MFRFAPAPVNPLRLLVIGCAAVLALPAHAVERAELVRMLDQALPDVIGSNNSALVGRMLDARFGRPIAQNLDVNRSLRTVFGRRSPTLDEGCRRTTTASGAPSTEKCVASIGALAGNGGYTEFAWNRNLEFGNVHFLRRDPDGTVAPGALPAVQLSNQEAYTQATSFLTSTLGIPPAEFAATTPGAKPGLPVRTLLVGEVDPAGKRLTKPVMKLVKFPRTVQVELPDRAGGTTTTRIRAPGEAYAMINDTGIWMARVQNWPSLERSPMIDQTNAKTRDELVDEMADALMRIDDPNIVNIGAQLVIAEPDPGFPAAQLSPAAAIIMPGVEISVSVVPRDPSESQQSALGPNTAGHTHQFALVRLPESSVQSDD